MTPSLPVDLSQPVFLPPDARARVAVLSVLHEGYLVSPGSMYRIYDQEPDPVIAGLPTLAEGLYDVLAIDRGQRRVFARVSGAERPFLMA